MRLCFQSVNMLESCPAVSANLRGHAVFTTGTHKPEDKYTTESHFFQLEHSLPHQGTYQQGQSRQNEHNGTEPFVRFRFYRQLKCKKQYAQVWKYLEACQLPYPARHCRRNVICFIIFLTYKGSNRKRTDGLEKDHNLIALFGFKFATVFLHRTSSCFLPIPEYRNFGKKVVKTTVNYDFHVIQRIFKGYLLAFAVESETQPDRIKQMYI